MRIVVRGLEKDCLGNISSLSIKFHIYESNNTGISWKGLRIVRARLLSPTRSIVDAYLSYFEYLKMNGRKRAVLRPAKIILKWTAIEA